MSEINAEWAGDGTWTPPAGFNTDSKFKDFCKATCAPTTDEGTWAGSEDQVMSAMNCAGVLIDNDIVSDDQSRQIVLDIAIWLDPIACLVGLA